MVLLSLLGLATSVWPPSAKAENAPTRDYAVKTVSYSSEQSGSKLKWLPYRGSKVISDNRVVPAGGVSAVAEGEGSSRDASVGLLAPEGPNKAAPSATDKGEPKFDAPQGLKRAAESPPLRLAEPLSDKALQKSPAEAMPGALLPPLRTEEVIPRNRLQNEGLAIPPLVAKPVKESCPTLEELNLKRINQITNNITPKGGDFPFECPLKKETYEPRCWPVITYTWKASGACHKPLYFEEAQLERYGHSLPPYIQPVASAAHFFLVVPALPYFMGVYPPNECIYTLGYYRPGSCAPYLLDPFPISIRGAMFEAAAWTGAVFAIP